MDLVAHVLINVNCTLIRCFSPGKGKRRCMVQTWHHLNVYDPQHGMFRSLSLNTTRLKDGMFERASVFVWMRDPSFSAIYTMG